MEIWDYYFGAICSIRFHPKNDVTDPAWEIEKAGRYADLMIKEREKRCQLQQHLSEQEAAYLEALSEALAKTPPTSQREN